MQRRFAQRDWLAASSYLRPPLLFPLNFISAIIVLPFLLLPSLVPWRSFADSCHSHHNVPPCRPRACPRAYCRPWPGEHPIDKHRSGAEVEKLEEYCCSPGSGRRCRLLLQHQQCVCSGAIVYVTSRFFSVRYLKREVFETVAYRANGFECVLIGLLYSLYPELQEGER